MSLEVDGRQDNAPIPYQREDEGLIYLNGPGTRWHHGQHLHGEQTHEKHLEIQPSKPEGHSCGQVTAVPTRATFFWSVLFCFVSVLAVVAAGISGSVAAKRGKNLNSWSVPFCWRVKEMQMLTAKSQYEHRGRPSFRFLTRTAQIIALSQTYSSNANNSSTADAPPPLR